MLSFWRVFKFTQNFFVYELWKEKRMSSAGKLLAIKLPDQKVTKLNVNADTTVGQVNDILAKSVKDLAPGDEYGISMDSIVFDRNSKIAKIPAVCYSYFISFSQIKMTKSQTQTQRIN